MKKKHLTGFELKQRDIAEKIILLEIRQERYFLLCANKKESTEIEITNKIDEFCRRLSLLNINEWNHQHFAGEMIYFPDFYWSLSVSADEICAACNGYNGWPENWKEFIQLLHELGIEEKYL